VGTRRPGRPGLDDHQRPTTTRPFNRANETTSAPGGAAPPYDDAGNTTAKNGRADFYDALRRRTV